MADIRLITIKEIAQMRGVSDQAVNKQIGDLEPVELRSGNRAARYSLDSYIDRVNTRPGRRSFDEERTRLTKEQADKQAMDNAERRGELAPMSYYEEQIESYARQLVAILDIIPPAIRQTLPHLSRSDYARIDAIFTQERGRFADRMSGLAVDD
jgi:phage terminase Nu1 subunit (DNA packaging protein)